MNKTGSRQALIPFALGFFSIAAQALLFRWFFAAFENNELGISAFFFSWLLWVTAGALAAQIPALRRLAGPGFARSLWIYIPAFFLQQWLILNARAICGVASYEAFPFARLFAAALLLNAPVSFVTGLLFTLACRWLDPDEDRRVTRVYSAEALGSVLGGAWVTALLALLPDTESVALLTMLALAVLYAFHRFESRLARFLIIAAALILSAALPHAGRWRGLQTAQARWETLVPGSECDGRFATPLNTYLHGFHNGQFNIVCGNTIIETVPDNERTGELIAIHLAQKPDAKNILIAGEGAYALARGLLLIPQVERVVWLPTDPVYGRKLAGALPDELKTGDTRLLIPGEDIQRHLARPGSLYDLIILHLPDPVALDLHRFFTQQFLRDVQARLAPYGVISLRTTGGENFLGSERIFLGASLLATVESVFPQVALKPGDETWFMASASDRISQSAQELANRFEHIEGSDAVYPAEVLLSLYSENRAAFQFGKYREAIREQPPESLISTTDSPRALFHTLQLLTREISLDSRMMPFLLRLSHKGWLLLIFAIVLCMLLRRAHSPAGGTEFDGRYLVFSTGLAGLALNIVLMVLYQSRFGSIYLHIGLLTAAFMLGIWIGSIVGRIILRRKPAAATILLTGLLTSAAGLCLLIPAVWQTVGQPVFMFLFLAAGSLGGAFMPAAAHMLGNAGMDENRMGAVVEMTDHLGGAAGGVLTGLVLLPVMGIRRTLLLLAALLLSNLVPLIPSRSRRTAPRGPGWIFTALWLAGVLLFGGYLLREPSAAGRAPVPSALLELAGKRELRPEHLPDGTVYFTARDRSTGKQYYLFTAESTGYGGPIMLAVMIETSGTLDGFRIVQHSETPAYIERLAPWMKSLSGKNIFGKTFPGDVDTVTGATATSAGIRNALAAAGQDFLARLEGRAAAAAQETAAAPAARAPRKADIQKIKSMIHEGKLSGREALHYIQLDE